MARHFTYGLLGAVVIGSAFALVSSAAPQPGSKKVATTDTPFQRPDDETLKKSLNPTQYKVACEGSTEPPFQNAYWDNHAHGIYVDVVSGEPLFSSIDKFDSGTGWPSFTKPLEKEHVVNKSDRSYGMVRTEVRSKYGDSHLGHVFDDGPRDQGGMRYCINSASLRFVPVEKIYAEGLGKYVPAFEAKGIKTDAPDKEVALMAGGCFWGMEDLLRKIPGVVETEVGYTGGDVEAPTYEKVKKGTTGHAESVQVTFNPKKLSYEELLAWFFRMHDPTTVDRQGNDRGTQYRSALFFTSATQEKIAQRVKRAVDQGGKWKAPVVTQIVPAKTFTKAEDYHQDYLVKNPGGYTCHFLRD